MSFSPSKFTVPRDGDMFVEQILDRSKDLIACGIWEGFDPLRLDRWMNNFKSDVARYFSACLIDALIYRSEPQTVALMRQLFQRVLPDALLAHPPQAGPVDDWLGHLMDPDREPQIRIVPVIKREDPPTKSGPHLARIYKRRLGLNPDWMIWPWQIPRARADGVHCFLFIDDFLGTGEQFTEFAQDFSLNSALNGAYCIYAPLAAHEAGLDYVHRNVPNVHVAAIERLDSSYNLFDEKSMWFNDGLNTPALAKDFYYQLLVDNNLPIQPKHRKGYGGLSIAYAFRHATPDNCLPIFWMRTRNWEPLLER